MSSVFETGKTIGLELEAPDIFDNCRLQGFQKAHDASIVTPAKGKGNNIWEKIPKNLTGFEQFNLGTELVSVDPIKINEHLEQFLKEKLASLFSYGQTDLTTLSERAGIHIHITCPVNLRLFKEILNLGAHLEDVFFLLGGYGKDYRGKTNNSVYARPITKFGPPIIDTRNGFAQVFNIDDLLGTKDIDEFICYYGNSERFRDRYVPVRYTWLNLLPIIRQGSLEFRVFNITQNPLYLTSTVFLVKWFLEKAMERSYTGSFEKLKENSVYDDRDTEDIIKTLIDIAEGEISDKHLNILCSILEKTPIDSIRFNKNYVYSHLMVHPTRGNSTGTFWRRDEHVFNYSPPIIPDSKIKKPVFMDSHQAKNFTKIQKKNFFANLKPDKITKSNLKKEKSISGVDFSSFISSVTEMGESEPEPAFEQPQYYSSPAEIEEDSEGRVIVSNYDEILRRDRERREQTNQDAREISNNNNNNQPRTGPATTIRRRRLSTPPNNTYNNTFDTSMWTTGASTIGSSDEDEN